MVLVGQVTTLRHILRLSCSDSHQTAPLHLRSGSHLPSPSHGCHYCNFPHSPAMSISLHVVFVVVFFMWTIFKSCPTLLTPRTVVCQAPLSMGFSRQEYWSGLPFPPVHLPDPGVKPGSPALQADSLPIELCLYWICYKIASVVCVDFLALRHLGS